MIGSAFGPYTLEEELGQGTLGMNYRATDTRNSRRVVLKVLRPELKSSDAYWNLLIRESSKLRSLKHRHIAQVYEFIEDRGERVIAQELVRGHTLQQELDYRGGSLPLPRLYIIFRQILSAIGQAHSAGIIHLALSPNKIMISRTGEEDRIKILDFGLGPFYDKGVEKPGWNVLDLDLSQAAYVSPDQHHKAMCASERSDLYAIGILLYEGATSYVPFGGDNLYLIVRGHLLDQPAPPSTLMPEIPWYLSATILKAIAKHPDDRFEDARDFGYHLIACQTGAVVAMTQRKIKVARVPTGSTNPSLKAMGEPTERHEEGDSTTVSAIVLPPEPVGSGEAAPELSRASSRSADQPPETSTSDAEEEPVPSQSTTRSNPRVSLDRLMSRLSTRIGVLPISEEEPASHDGATEALAQPAAASAPSPHAPADNPIEPPTGAKQVQKSSDRGEPQQSSPPASSADGSKDPAPSGGTGRGSRPSWPELVAAGPATLPRALEPRDLKPLPEGVPNPSYLKLLRVVPGGPKPAVESTSVAALPTTSSFSKLGLGRAGFRTTKTT